MSVSANNTQLIQMEKYPQRAKELIDTAFMCIGEICIHVFECSGVFYIKATNLYGYRELLCKLTVIGDETSNLSADDIRIDFVSTNMSSEKKYYVLWLLERNRDFFYEEYKTKKKLQNSEVF